MSQTNVVTMSLARIPGRDLSRNSCIFLKYRVEISWGRFYETVSAKIYG
jgi:hypothetical protein